MLLQEVVGNPNHNSTVQRTVVECLLETAKRSRKYRPHEAISVRMTDAGIKALLEADQHNLASDSVLPTLKENVHYYIKIQGLWGKKGRRYEPHAKSWIRMEYPGS